MIPNQFSIAALSKQLPFRDMLVECLLVMTWGMRQVEGKVKLVSFMNCDMAYLNMELSRVWALENLFSPKVLVSVIGKGVKHIVDTGHKAYIRYVSFMADWLGEILVREHRIRRSRDYSFLTI